MAKRIDRLEGAVMLTVVEVFGEQDIGARALGRGDQERIPPGDQISAAKFEGVGDDRLV
jgi:hypothetical protein